tara:strand:- start:50 stop:745 length:696 start_codon:yes stop_codon:yes gene_type:complete
MKKIIIIFLFSILILLTLAFILDKKIINFVIEKNLSNIINFNSNFKINRINYFSQQIEITDLKIKNKKNYFNENVFEATKVLIEYDLTSIFSDLIIIKSILLIEPKFYFEILEKKIERNQNENLKDNVDLIKTINQENPKKYPKKKKDKNFIIKIVKINNSSAYVKAPQNKSNININLSNMKFQNVGNADKNGGHKFQHFKDIFKIILMDIYFKIPDQSLKELVKKNYKIN